MMNPAAIMQIKGMWDEFTRQHPKFPMFLTALMKKGLKEDDILEIKITKSNGETMETNLEITQKDLELFEAIKQMKS